MWPPPASSLSAVLTSPELVVSRVCLGSVVALWLLGCVAPSVGEQYFGLIPGNTLSNYYLWTFVTAGAFDNAPIMVHSNSTHSTHHSLPQTSLLTAKGPGHCSLCRRSLAVSRVC